MPINEREALGELHLAEWRSGASSVLDRLEQLSTTATQLGEMLSLARDLRIRPSAAICCGHDCIL